ncbi:MAG: hypothetical protein IKO61_05325 [Lachnospiraceae bacterium]|nr:hypothetical protein [Lachnospiraceae bacterium]
MKNNAITGKPANGYRMEAVRIKLTGDVSKTYNVYYQTYVQKFGWLGWAKNDAISGSLGYGYRVEGIKIKLVKKTATQPTSSKPAYKKK